MEDEPSSPEFSLPMGMPVYAAVEKKFMRTVLNVLLKFRVTLMYMYWSKVVWVTTWLTEVRTIEGTLKQECTNKNWSKYDADTTLLGSEFQLPK